MTDNDLVTLAAGPLLLRLSPSIGGAIAGFDFAGATGTRRILRKCNSPEANVLAMGNFPLVPYVNRIRGGRFSFRGREVTLAPNMAGDPSPLHGQGWLGSWTVERLSGNEAVLGFRHRAAEWPWDYEAKQHFALDAGGLSLSLSCRNLSPGPRPCGRGQHP